MELKTCHGLAGFLRSADSCCGLLLKDMAVFVIDTEGIDKGTLEGDFLDGRVLREIRQRQTMR